MNNDTLVGGGIDNYSAVTMNNSAITGFIGYGIDNEAGATTTLSHDSISGVAAYSSYSIYNNATVSLNYVNFTETDSALLNTSTASATGLQRLHRRLPG